MAQTLNKGAPLDVQFVNNLINSIEKLEADSNSSQYKRTTVKNTIFESASATTVRTADARIYTATFRLNTNGATRGTAIKFDLALENFATAPVVTVTPIVTNEQSQSPAVSVVITGITSSTVRGYVYPHDNVPQSATLALSLIAIGIPGNSTGTATTNMKTNSLNMTPPAT